MQSIHKYGATACLLFAAFASCNKADFLDTKPNQSLVIPSTISDYQALLDDDNTMNYAFGVPYMGEEGCDNYYVTTAQYTSAVIDDLDRNICVWAQQLYAGQEIPDWDIPYQWVFYANSALGGLATTSETSSNQTAYNNVKGSALFYRAHAFYQLAQEFAPPYDSSTAGKDLGIPLRLSSDLNEKIVRSSVQQTYDQIISDLHNAEPLLPNIGLYNTRPSLAAVYGLLARVYQTVGDYPLAKSYADSCLRIYDVLIDFNILPKNVFSAFVNNANDGEEIFKIMLHTNNNLCSTGKNYCDSNLQNSFNVNDLRAFFWLDPVYNAPQYYSSAGCFRDNAPFAGIATDEIYLIRAESEARMGATDSAMNDLNTLLQTRWITGTFVPYTATSADDALQQILTERRKELLLRGLRWTDLRRLNKDPRFAITLTRIVNGVTYTLPPNDPRYTYPIPQNVLALNAGMQDNPR